MAPLFTSVIRGYFTAPYNKCGRFMWWSSFQTAQACFFVKAGMISREMTKFPVALAWFLSKRAVFPWNDKISGGISLFLSKRGCFSVEWQNFKRHKLAFCQISRPAPSLQKIHPFYPSIFCKWASKPLLCKKIFRFSLLFFANELQNPLFAKISSILPFYFLQISFKAPSLQKFSV